MQKLNHIYSNLHTYPSPEKLSHNLSSNIKILGIGSARLVIQDPNNINNVIKLGAGKGIEQNKNEINVWETSKKRNISNLLIPIIKYDSEYKWIKMPKVSTSFGLDKYHGPSAKRIYNELKNKNIHLREIETCMFKNEPRAFDYGAIECIKPINN